MTIEDALELLRSDYVEEDIKALNSKDRLFFWSQLEEFVRPKMMRGNTVAETEHTDRDIKIILVDKPESNTHLS